MKQLLVLNDTHLGAIRSAGTTTQSRLSLRAHLLHSFTKLLPKQGTDLMILGDLFDTHDTESIDLWETYNLLKQWLSRGDDLYLVAGNHDLSKTTSVFSSFELLSKLLTSAYPQQVHVVLQSCMTPYGYVIPHVPSQQEFDLELSRVPPCKVLFLHVNYNNKFAAQSDQSLNLTPEQVQAAPAEQIVIAHEHNMRKAGKVILPGNQIASSVSDWVSSPAKYQTRVDAENGAVLEKVLEAGTQYSEVDWKSPAVTDHLFVRVVGTATADEASSVVAAVAKIRTLSPALVVSNAVKIESHDGVNLAESLASIQGFNIWAALEQCMEPAEIAILKGLQ